MLIQTVIDHIKEYHKGVFEGKQIDEQTTRDKVLYGNPHQECTGIITTCWASVDVIREAAKRGANLSLVLESRRSYRLAAGREQPVLSRKEEAAR